jgi:ribosome-binding factor A
VSHRIERVNQLIRQEISGMLQREIKDPRLGQFIAVTEVVTSADLRHAKVYISFISSQQQKQAALDALTGASNFFRKEMAKNLRLRRIPDLSFHWDDSIERGAHIMDLIDRVSSSDQEEP